MRKIAEMNVLLREHIQLPAGLKLATDEFREGWNFLKPTDGNRLEKRVLKRGWSFIKMADGLLRSGVGKTAQEAVDCALKLTLRRVSEHFNAAKIERIELTKYPWFTLARVSVYPYLIQKGAVLPVPDQTPTTAVMLGRKRTNTYTAELFPGFGNSMPVLREILVTSSAEATMQ